ncbi:hypothetical protein [Pseudobacteroides cellulosolvens]|uniref:Prenyltransferase/squalene oxidase n=1 Tax=Pseudobacteroides cellulosolvens ATCC 35603 = DSM 2933 TaxID=398512 RepID=A0A0L6JSA1_9FIRM|nr:hypothetical protein [Pseudobacteroides cellulosolvens]KNY28688.1 hypothetical protein Bccel_3962 [Pseudobacteroides cellulosolvens ATCC 35603 = DSM 2933]
MNMSKSDFQTIRNWIYRNARPLDNARWRYHFENGSNEDVLKALATYQNADGGFGHAIEADSWNPNSSPISTTTAIEILREIRFIDINHSIIKGILAYFDTTTDFTGEYWLSSTPTNNDYPHAPWWNYPNNESFDWGYNPTAMIAGFILYFADRNTGIYKKAEKIAMQAIDKYLNGVMENGEAYNSVKREGELRCFNHLLEYLEAAELTQVYQATELRDTLIKQVDIYIEKDNSKWNGYCCKPSTFITSPDSIFFKGNEDILNTELDYILKNRNQDGVWNITWSWGSYEKEFAISENWWKANIAILNMLLLRNFSRL